MVAGVQQITPTAYLLENHDAAYYLWREHGCTGKILVHIDAHHDMWWIDTIAELTIANYICPALKENIVREIWWVVPDGTWERYRSRRALRIQLNRLVEKYPQRSRRPEMFPSSAQATLLGRSLRVCSLDGLPPFDEPILLDIDTDYFLIPDLASGRLDCFGRLPWCWPEQAARLLHRKNIRWDLLTVSYSVEGGYTPLRWKYLGDEIACRLSLTSNSQLLRGFELLRKAALSQKDCRALLLEACELLPTNAAPRFHLALLEWRAGHIEEARNWCAEAIRLDPFYRTPYAGPGFLLQWKGLARQALRAHLRLLDIDPLNWYARVGLAQVLARLKRLRQAEHNFRTVLEQAPESIDALRGLADLLSRQGQIAEAIRLYESSLRLALHGRGPIGSAIVTEQGTRLLDSGHAAAYKALAALYLKSGQDNRAINTLRMCIGARPSDPLPRLSLAVVYLKRGAFCEAFQHLCCALPALGRALWQSLLRQALRLIRLVRFFTKPAHWEDWWK